MEDGDSGPVSVRARIALLQQRTNDRDGAGGIAHHLAPRPSSSSPSPSSASTTAVTAIPASPAKSSPTSAHSHVHARSHSHSRPHSPVPVPVHDALSEHLDLDDESRIRHRSHTLDLAHPALTTTTTTHDRRPPPPQLPPRRSATLDPLSPASARDPSRNLVGATPSSSPATRSISPNPNPNPNPNPPSAFPSPRSQIPSSSSTTGPPLPRRKPTLPSVTSSSPRISPRTPLASTFEPPLPRRPLTASKQNFNDPLSDVPFSRPTQFPQSVNGTPRTSSSNRDPPTSTFKIRPVDPRARRRYEHLFYQCLSSVSPNRQSSRTSGSARDRGNGHDAERIEGEIVRLIWERSRLSRDVLRAVWNEVSPKSASLDREGFIRGMWLIDEELRRRQRND